jgi:hypothetical protein
MGSTFNQGQAALAKYWYERQIFTYGPVALAAGLSTVFTATNFNPNPKSPDWVAELVGIWVTPNANVQLQWVYDNQVGNQSSAQGFTDGSKSGVNQVAVGAPAARNLQLLVNNTGGVVANFQLTYEVAMRRLSAADKLLLGYDLSAQDLQNLSMLDRGGPNGQQVTGLQQVRDLVDRGTSPASIEFQISRTLDNRRLGDHPSGGLFHVNASVSSNSNAFTTLQAAPGEFLVLRELAVEGGQAITLFVDRDGDSNYLQLNGAAFVQTLDNPWLPFIPALQVLNFKVSATAPLDNVPVRIRVERYRMSHLWRVRLGLVRDRDPATGDAYEKVWAGIA